MKEVHGEKEVGADGDSRSFPGGPRFLPALPPPLYPVEGKRVAEGEMVHTSCRYFSGQGSALSPSPVRTNTLPSISSATWITI